MFHRRSRLRLNQKPAHALLLQRNLVTSLLLYESIRTTRKRARVIQPIIDRLIATAKRSDAMNAVRALNRVVTDRNASRKVMEVLIQRFEKRPSGFTRMVPVGARKGDGAQLVDLMLMDMDARVPEQAMAAPKEKKAPKEKTKTMKKASSPQA